jgi:predicted transglutaminase-like cysteine proteinase
MFCIRTVAAAFVLLLGTGVSCADPIDFDHPAFAPIIGPTSIPIGHAEFCANHRDECSPNGSVLDAIELTEERWQLLIAVNNRINTEIVPITDEDFYRVTEYWTYPDSYGDCEDYVLAKRRALIDEGWEPSVLLIVVVREHNGAGHAVLMVRTDRGDLVLDNQVGAVKPWHETNYQFIKRQSQENAGEWVLIDDSRYVVSTTASN